MNVRRLLLATVSFVAELALWILPATIFIFAYVVYFNGPSSAISPHLKLVGAFAIAMLGLRLIAEYAARNRTLTLLFRLAYSTALMFMLLYFVIILVGLDSWGRVPTWQLMSVYFGQWRELVSVLDIPTFAVPLALVVFFFVLLLLVRFVHTYLKWPHYLAGIARFRLSVVLVAAGFVPFVVLAVETYEGVNHKSGEPAMLSLNAGVGVELTQNSLSEGARLLDKREAAAAASYKPGALASPRNVILIVGDALRGDHISALQYSRLTTPSLESLSESRNSALAQHAFSVCAESYCGLMSIARSKFVHEFSRASLTLQTVLAQHGYKIALLLGGDHTNFYGLSEALGDADIYWDGSMSAEYVNDDRAVVNRVGQLPEWDGNPLFLQLHLMSSHGLGQRQEKFLQYGPSRNYYRRWSGASDESKQIWAANYYDNGLLQFDSVVDDLLSTLDQRGYLGDALVIVTGDHGEMLGEHGFYGHAATVYRPVLDIPLLILRFGYEGPEFIPRAFISQVDIAPTILQELGLPVPTSWSGIGLHGPSEREFVFFQQSSEVGLYDVRDAGRPWKVWTDLRSEKFYAFDILGDPDETHNVIDNISPDLRAEWTLELLPASITIGERLLKDFAGNDIASPDRSPPAADN